MPDISMCTQTLCPNAPHCYRIQATPDEHWQAYTQFEYEIGESGIKCDYYMPTYDSVTTGTTSENNT